MNFMRHHWFDIGIALAVAVSVYVFLTPLRPLSLVLWINLLALFVHQFEEYRYPGYFPGMMNVVIFTSTQPDRYPLNTNTALIVNVMIGWLLYALAAVFGTQVVWFGIAVMLISVGNVIAHTVLFNFKGKTFYNPGMITADMLFLPIILSFFYLLVREHAATVLDWIMGIGLGIALNYVGVLKLIDWLKDKQTVYSFPKRCLPPTIRKACLS